MDKNTKRGLGRREFLLGLLTAGAGLAAGSLMGKSPFPSSAATTPGAAGSDPDVYRVNVKDFGAKGDGKSDDSAAFTAAMNRIWSRYGQTVTGHRRPTAKLYIPPGTYLIKSAQALMPAKMTSPNAFMGLIIEGAGRFVSQILFQPSAKDAYLLYNNNTFLHLIFRDIGFVAKSSAAHFMYSLSSGNAQNYRFDNVAWTGTWGYGIVLAGTNTNSEMGWYHCGISGSWNAFLHVPQSVGKSGDQFVNYNFYDTHFEVEQGSFLNMQYGGSVNIWGGSIMYYGEKGGTFFVFGNSIHNGGAMRFLCQGVRFELPNANCRLIDCAWAAGSVTFVGCDNASQQFLGTGVTGGVNAIFRLGNESGPSVSWIGCVLQGKHEYRYASHAYDHAARISYSNCEISQYATPGEFIVRTGEKDAPESAAPVVAFVQCRGKPGPGQALQPFDATLGWGAGYRSVTVKKYLRLASPDNRLPKSGEREEAALPIGAVITSVRVHAPSAGEASSGWSYELRTSSGTGTVIAAAAPNADVPAFFVCDSDDKRRIALAAGAQVSVNAQGFCLVEYLG